jgi:hypothetical protein
MSESRLTSFLLTRISLNWLKSDRVPPTKRLKPSRASSCYRRPVTGGMGDATIDQPSFDPAGYRTMQTRGEGRLL